MAHTAETGPAFQVGFFGVAGQTAPLVNPDAGPSGSFQGSALLDPRVPNPNGSNGPFFMYDTNPYFILIDAVPSAANGSTLASQQTVTSGTAMTLNGSGTSVAQIILTNPGAAYVSAPTVTITGGTTSATATAVLAPNGTIAQINLTASGAGFTAAPVVTLTAAPTGGTTATAATYLAAHPVTTITPWPATAAVIPAGGTAYALDGPFTPLTPSRVHSIFDPTKAIARNIQVTNTNAADTGWFVTVKGYDLYGVAMSEKIAVTANASAFGKKAFKYVVSCTPTNATATTTTGKIYIGTGDTIGLPIYTPLGEYLSGGFYNGSYISSTTGYVKPDQTTPATSTTGDPRGTYLLQSQSSNGSARLMVGILQGTLQVVTSSPTNTWPMFGVTQA